MLVPDAKSPALSHCPPEAPVRLSARAWPPTDAAAMRAWQAAVGDDAAIARHLGLSRATVYIHRRRHGVAALPRASDRRVREKRPRARISSRAMARLYAGRRYEDLRLRRTLPTGTVTVADAGTDAGTGRAN